MEHPRSYHVLTHETSSMFDELESATSASSRVQYRRDYLNPDEQVVFSEQVDSLGLADSEPDHAILVIRQLYTNQAKDAYRPDLPSSVVSSGSTLIIIKSRAVIHALRTVVGYYPDSSFTGDTVKIREPFPVLYHYREELYEYACQFPYRFNIFGCKEDLNVAGDIRSLLSLFHEICGRRVVDELARYRLEVPTCTHDMLWMLFKPGTDIYVDANDDNTYNGFVVRDIAFQYADEKSSEYDVQYWNIAASPTHVGASRPLKTTIETFTGEKAISDLALFPCRFMDVEKHGTSDAEHHEQLVKRGKMMFDLMKGHGFAYFDGYTAKHPTLKQPPIAHRGRVMIDMHQYAVDTGEETHLATDVETSNVITPRCGCSHCAEVSNTWAKRRITFAGYSKIFPMKVSKLSDHQSFLTAYGVWAYLLKQRTWKFLRAEGLSWPKFRKDPIDTLIMPASTRELLRGLCWKFTSGNPWSADFVQGKGEGNIVLLHGPPGVGKTYTAECVAELVKKPLISLTSSDLGTEPEAVEQRLLRWFDLANVWNAVLLIDEADVFLERRSSSDLRRNNLVVIFLRTLEYYRGILFLTTNRVGTFDEAFLSRIDVAVYFPPLSSESRVRLWSTFISKLENERRGEIRVGTDFKSYIRNDRDLLNLQLNGREIRSSFQTAVALAEIEAREPSEMSDIVLEWRHIAKVVEMSRDFKRYIDDTHLASLEEMAMRMGHRADPSDLPAPEF